MYVRNIDGAEKRNPSALKGHYHAIFSNTSKIGQTLSG